jgi:hypothetical protein
MTKDAVIRLLKQKQGDRSLREFAREVGVTAAYLSDIYQGRREPGPAIQRYLGVRREIRYEYVQEK